MNPVRGPDASVAPRRIARDRLDVVRVAVFTGSRSGPPSHRSAVAQFAAGLASAVERYEHPARKWQKDPPPLATRKLATGPCGGP